MSGSAVEPDGEEERTEEGAEHPRGTLFLMMVFLIAIVGLWSYLYLIMLDRG